MCTLAKVWYRSEQQLSNVVDENQRLMNQVSQVQARAEIIHNDQKQTILNLEAELATMVDLKRDKEYVNDLVKKHESSKEGLERKIE